MITGTFSGHHLRTMYYTCVTLLHVIERYPLASCHRNDQIDIRECFVITHSRVTHVFSIALTMSQRPSTIIYILVAYVQLGHNMSTIHYVLSLSILDSCEH